MVLANLALARVTLPVEVVGESGTTASVNVEVPVGRARQVRSLWVQIHNLAYADMMSVQVNGSNWMSLNNHAVSIAEPGKSYGGISGGFSTLKVTLPLPGQTVVDGVNAIRFRFNGTGFRVLAFNLKDSGEEPVLAADTFAEEDPNVWTPPLKGLELDFCGGCALAERALDG
jgi:hypothetical protein